MVTEYGVVFDLDDTLVWEQDYVRSGFRAVAQSVAGAVCSEGEAFGLLWGRFERAREETCSINSLRPTHSTT